MVEVSPYEAVDFARRKYGLPEENYWLYVKKDGKKILAYAEEHKNAEYIGFFVEDDSRIANIMKVAERKIKAK